VLWSADEAPAAVQASMQAVADRPPTGTTG
jgi:hypothetical protein